MQRASSGAPICFYGGTETAGDLTESLYAGLIFGDATTGSLIDRCARTSRTRKSWRSEA